MKLCTGFWIGMGAGLMAGAVVGMMVPSGGDSMKTQVGRSIHKLGVAVVHHAVNAVAGGLGLVGHDGDLLAHQSVGQAGLTHIGSAANGDHSGFGNVVHSFDPQLS